MFFRRNLVVGLTAALVVTVAPMNVPGAAAAPDDKPVLKPATATSRASGSKGTVVSLGKGAGEQIYLVALDSPAVPTRATARRSPGARVPNAATYRKQILDEQLDVKSSIRTITGKSPKIVHTYTNAVNGFAVRLTRAQARKVSQLPGIAAVKVDETRDLHTDVGPEWIGAPEVWDGTDVPGGVGSKGEGVVVGVIDTGINPANPSFAATVPVEDGGDGYVVTNPRPKRYGVCDPANADYNAAWPCNDKLIGYYDFLPDGEDYDYEGHGTHTASTAAGNQVSATTYSAKGTADEFSVTRTIKGVAPHANIIAYAGCCTTAALTASIDQAIADQVDVINYSIGSSAPTTAPWADFDAIGFLNARAAGINVAVSAGNDGPGAATLGSPADVPWVTSVGATQHNRQWQAAVTGISASGGATLPDMHGVGFSGPTASGLPVIDGKDAGDELCHLADPAHPAAAHLDPAKVAGKIVVCVRGDNGRVEKGSNVASLGGKGMILVNDQASGTSLNADAHDLPAVHLSYADGVTLREWLKTATDPVATLSGGQEHIGTDVADIMAAFSSRGENRALSLVGPSVSAPGVDILAANGTGNEVSWGFMSGTSMASPHTAGALALLDAVQPGWTPAERQSALMSTAVTAVKDNDGTDADWFDMGSGRIDLRLAAKAGFVMDETFADYVAANPGEGGDVRTLNLASMADDECLATCSWTRTLTGTSTGVGTWQATVSSADPGLSLELASSSIALTDGGNAPLGLTATVAPGTSTDKWLMGEVTLTPPAGSDAPVAHLPVAVLPTNGVLPKSIDITTRRDAGSQVATGLETIAASDLQTTPSGLVPGSTEQLTLSPDPTNDDPYDGLTPDQGVFVKHVTVPAGAARLVAKLSNTDADDLDMYVGTGEVSADNLICTSATGSANESCDVASPPAGDVWILVQDWDGGGATSNTVDLLTAVVGGDAGNLTVTGPDSVEAGTPYSLTTTWDEDALTAGQQWFGAVTLGSSPASPTDIGVVPVNLTRADDDVTVHADKTDVHPGDVVTYTVDIAPNVTQTDLDYSVTAPIPAGTNYVPGSATGGATFADGKVSFTKTLATAYGDPGSYAWTTSDNDESCLNPFTGDADYLDLEDFGLKADPDFNGDTQSGTYLATKSFRLYDKLYDGLTVTDDGFVAYGGDYDATGLEPWTPQTLPDATQPNGLAALMWNDGQVFYDAAANSGVTVASAGDLGVIEYDDLRAYNDQAGAAGSLDMEMFAIASDPDVTFAYDNVQVGSGLFFNPATIGVEGPDGTYGEALVNHGNAGTAIHDGLVVCGTYSEPAAAGASFTYQVEIGSDPALLDNGPLPMTVTSTTSDPASKPVDVTATVQLSGIVETTSVKLGLVPTSIKAGGTTAATATVTTTDGSTPAGKVQFLVDGAVRATGTIAGASGKATVPLSGIASGTHQVTARYIGTGTTALATSTAVVLTVAPKLKPTVRVSGPAKAKFRTRPVVTAKVSAAGVVPTGKVRFTVRYAGKVHRYTVTLSRTGTAKLKLLRLTKRSKVTVTATYLGDTRVGTGTSKPWVRRVR